MPQTDERTRSRHVTQIGGMVSVEFGLDHTDGYRVTVGWSDEDKAWIARCSGVSTGDVIGFGAFKDGALLCLACALASTVDALNDSAARASRSLDTATETSHGE